MFGVRLRSLFTSRWMALAWSVLVCLTAVQWVGSSSGGKAQAKSADQSASADHSRAQADQEDRAERKRLEEAKQIDQAAFGS